MEIKHKDIYYHKAQDKWMVNIRYKGEHYHLGYFPHNDEGLTDAIKARDAAYLELFGVSTPTFSKRKLKIEKLKDRLKKEKELPIPEADRKLIEMSKEKNIREIIS